MTDDKPVSVEGHLDVDVKHSSIGKAIRGRWWLVAALVAVVLAAFAFGALALKEAADHNQTHDLRLRDLRCISSWVDEFRAHPSPVPTFTCYVNR